MVKSPALLAIVNLVESLNKLKFELMRAICSSEVEVDLV